MSENLSPPADFRPQIGLWFFRSRPRHRGASVTSVQWMLINSAISWQWRLSFINTG